MNITFVEGSKELLDRVAPLWEKLNEHHVGISTFFEEDLGKRTSIREIYNGFRNQSTDF
ncbi:hypothetical protein [Desulfosporosinus sp. SB140]|uniref:hypothetical protein n=1 Tax=Desulfosporosinus paludis TaxID=3115649 RepID=UPI00388E39B2